MAWPEDELNGALDGVSIHVKSRTKLGGRRTFLHSYPGREESWSEDTGKFPDRFRVQFVVLGPNYYIDRDRIEEILQTEGPYTYTDPWQGDVQVACEDEYELVEIGDGSAEFTVTFHIAGTLAFPIVVEPAAEVARAAAAALPQVEDEFADRFTLGDLFAAVLRGLGAANTALRVAKGKIASKLGMIDKLTSELTQLQNNVNDLANTPQAFANSFRHLAARVVDMAKDWKDLHQPKIPDGRGNEGSHRPAVDVLREVAVDFRDFDSGENDDSIDLTTPQGVQEQENLKAVTALVKQTTFCAVADALSQMVPDTADLAAEIKEQMAAFADEILSDPEISPEVYDSIADVQAAFVDYQVTVGQDLPSVKTVTIQRPTPVCVLAQQVLGDGSRDLELILRNDIRHPLFAEGEIEVVV